VRQLEKPAAGEIHIIVRSVAMVIRGLAAFGTTSSRLWGATHLDQALLPAPAPAFSKGQGVGVGKGPETEQVSWGVTGRLEV
jgi:hypothetical protein